MTIHRFYCPNSLVVGQQVKLPPTETAHALKVLRLRPGDKLMLLDGKGTTAAASLLPPEGNKRLHDAICLIEETSFVPPPENPVRLYVAPPKSRNMDIVLKSATELGVTTISPILCKYGVSRTECSTKESWEIQLITAVKQSANPWLPQLTPVQTFDDALKGASANGFFGAVPRSSDPKAILPWERPEGETSLWIGPEGGFSQEEESSLREHGLTPLTVGKWILRVETAVSALTACLMFNPN